MNQDRKKIKREEKRLGFIREAKNRRSGKKYNYDIRFPIIGDKFEGTESNNKLWAVKCPFTWLG